MTEFSVITSFELYFLLGFSVSVTVYGLRGSTGFDILNSLPVVSAHRRILGMAPAVCVLVKICVSSISFYKLDTDKLTTPFESAHQFTLVCTVSDSKTVPGCHYNLCSNHSFVLTD